MRVVYWADVAESSAADSLGLSLNGRVCMLFIKVAQFSVISLAVPCVSTIHSFRSVKKLGRNDLYWSYCAVITYDGDGGGDDVGSAAGGGAGGGDSSGGGDDDGGGDDGDGGGGGGDQQSAMQMNGCRHIVPLYPYHVTNYKY